MKVRNSSAFFPSPSVVVHAYCLLQHHDLDLLHHDSRYELSPIDSFECEPVTLVYGSLAISTQITKSGDIF